MRLLPTLSVLVLVMAAALPCLAEWKPADGPLFTRWAKEVSPKNALPEYPRPQMVRKRWQNLNGLWDYAIKPEKDKLPEKFDGQILVPYPVESALSGVMKRVGKDNRLWYRRTFEVPKDWNGEAVLLNFGAVDWDTTVWVNGKEVGKHRGGYDAFSIDISRALKDSGPQEIVLSVWDPTNAGYQPRGKQVSNPRGIWYTPVTGIWRTVWLEPVNNPRIDHLKIVPDIDKEQVTIDVNTVLYKYEEPRPGGLGVYTPRPSPIVAAEVRQDKASESPAAERGKQAKVVVSAGGKAVAEASGPADKPMVLKIDDAKLWSPDSPFLYDLKVTLSKDGKAVDEVESYFGMRKSSIEKDDAGVPRLFLNNKPLFQYGPLDQGWWPDGLYTAATDAALRYDVEMTKKMGMNMIRKHVKIEPARWYYHCDKLGVLVWQDMPNGGKKVVGDEADKNFRQELKALIDTHHNAPSIVMWVPFNEGWGQYDSEGITEWLKKYDPTRPVNTASGWSDRPCSDVHDVHKYPGPAMPAIEERRAAVLGEFGGLGLPVKDHLWWDKKNWGYRNLKTVDELTAAYQGLINRLHPMVGRGLSAAVYTQTSDVEGEVNGLMTYDRAMVKIGAEKLNEINRKLYLPPPVVKTILPTSRAKPQQWRHTTEKPGEGWEKPEFDDSKWKEAPGGFGTKDTPGTTVRTEWKTPDIWVRRTFTLEKVPADPHLMIHHDEDAEVYINGKLAAKPAGFTTDYAPMPVNKEAKAALKTGKNTIAIHCRQTTGGQYIDAGIVEVIEQ